MTTPTERALTAEDLIIALERIYLERDFFAGNDHRARAAAVVDSMDFVKLLLSLDAERAARAEPGLVERLARALRDWENGRHPLPSPEDDEGPQTWDAWVHEARSLLAAAHGEPQEGDDGMCVECGHDDNEHVHYCSHDILDGPSCNCNAEYDRRQSREPQEGKR